MAALPGGRFSSACLRPSTPLAAPPWCRACQASKGKQKGADGKFVQYMDGPMYALSFAVAKSIVVDDMAHSALYQM